MPIPAPEFTFWGVLTPEHYLSSYELSCVKIGSAIFAVGDDKYKQESLANAKVARDSLARQKRILT